jgi:hypothetical protein
MFEILISAWRPRHLSSIIIWYYKQTKNKTMETTKMLNKLNRREEEKHPPIIAYTCLSQWILRAPTPKGQSITTRYHREGCVDTFNSRKRETCADRWRHENSINLVLVPSIRMRKDEVFHQECFPHKLEINICWENNRPKKIVKYKSPMWGTQLTR